MFLSFSFLLSFWVCVESDYSYKRWLDQKASHKRELGKQNWKKVNSDTVFGITFTKDGDLVTCDTDQEVRAAHSDQKMEKYLCNQRFISIYLSISLIT